MTGFEEFFSLFTQTVSALPGWALKCMFRCNENICLTFLSVIIEFIYLSVALIDLTPTALKTLHTQ